MIFLIIGMLEVQRVHFPLHLFICIYLTILLLFIRTIFII